MAESLHTLGIDSTLETKLLLSCARTHIDAKNADCIRTYLQSNIDWEYLLQMALYHNVAPLLYRSLELAAPGVMPEVMRKQFKQQIQSMTQSNLFLTKELIQLLNLFKQHNIPAFPVKGPILATTLYGDLALRPFTDLDIMVHEDDLLRALDMFIASGYEILKPSQFTRLSQNIRSLLLSQLVNISPWSYHLVLSHPSRHGIIELHWRITPRFIFPSSSEPLWEDLVPITIGGVTTSNFSAENTLWFLCVHGAKQQWKRLGWVCDVAQLLSTNPELNWKQIIEQSLKLGVERRLYLGLLLAHDMVGAPLPNEIKSRIDSIPEIKSLADGVMKNFFNGTEPSTGILYKDILDFQLKSMDRLMDRGRYMLCFLTWELIQFLFRLNK